MVCMLCERHGSTTYVVETCPELFDAFLKRTPLPPHRALDIVFDHESVQHLWFSMFFCHQCIEQMGISSESNVISEVDLDTTLAAHRQRFFQPAMICSACFTEYLVNRLRELTLAMPRPECDWEERPRFDPPTSSEALDGFKSLAGFHIGDGIREFFHQTDGITALSIHNGYWLGGIGRLKRMLERNDVPRCVKDDSAIPIATDGGGNAFLLTANGRIYRWDHATHEVKQIATSFSEFLARVVADWEAYLANAPGWPYLV